MFENVLSLELGQGFEVVAMSTKFKAKEVFFFFCWQKGNNRKPEQQNICKTKLWNDLSKDVTEVQYCILENLYNIFCLP